MEGKANLFKVADIGAILNWMQRLQMRWFPWYVRCCLFGGINLEDIKALIV